MKTFKSAALLAAAGCLLVAVPAAHAQAPQPAATGPDTVDIYSDADAAAVLNARIVALKTVLELTPEQEKLWAPVEASIRKIAADSITVGRQRSQAAAPNDFLEILERVGDADGAVAEMLEQTGLRERADEQLGRLSGGNRQRVNIAIGLLARPVVVLLDEPSASLDPRQRERLWRFIGARAQAGTSIVFTTHDIGEAERYAARVLVLADGELLFSGSPADLRSHGGGDIESAFVEFLRERGH